jgi:hypothetical protein
MGEGAAQYPQPLGRLYEPRGQWLPLAIPHLSWGGLFDALFVHCMRLLIAR